jgi:hypothetical protein
MPSAPTPTSTDPRGNWFDSLGQPVPAERLEATLELLVEHGYDRGEAVMVLGVVAREIAHDEPDRAQRYMRSFVGRDETLVIRALATMCHGPGDD